MKNLKNDKLSQLDGGSFVLVPGARCPYDWVAFAATNALSWRPGGITLCSKESPFGGPR